MDFYYEGHDKLGQIVCGSVEAPTEEEAAQIIRKERGHYAREISPEDNIKKKYEIPAVGGVAPLPKDAIDPIPLAVAKAASVHNNAIKSSTSTQSSDWKDVLQKEIESISEVSRQMMKWRTEYLKSQETEDAVPLPDDFPKVGGKTWQSYYSNLEPIIEHLFKQALDRVVQIRKQQQ